MLHTAGKPRATHVVRYVASQILANHTYSTINANIGNHAQWSSAVLSLSTTVHAVRLLRCIAAMRSASSTTIEITVDSIAVSLSSASSAGSAMVWTVSARVVSRPSVQERSAGWRASSSSKSSKIIYSLAQARSELASARARRARAGYVATVGFAAFSASTGATPKLQTSAGLLIGQYRPIQRGAFASHVAAREPNERHHHTQAF